MTGRELDAAAGRATSRYGRLDLVGAGLFIALAGWVVVAAEVTGGNPWPMVLLVLGVGLTVFGARDLTRRFGVLVPVGVVGLLLAIIAVTWPAAIHRHTGLVGYSNANGALYAIGVGAAGLVILRARSLPLRIAAGVAAIFLAVLPWVFNADAAAGSALVVLGVTALLLVRRGPPRWLVPMVVLLAIVALVATITAGLLYIGDGEGDDAWRLTERRLVLWQDATDMVRVSPVTGVGPGEFAEHSPTARGDRDAGWAHHEPLTLAAETGVPGLVLLLAIVAWALVWLHRGSGRRGATLATVVLAVAFTHATIDYVWHNPGVPLMLAVVVGIGATAGQPADG